MKNIFIIIFIAVIFLSCKAQNKAGIYKESNFFVLTTDKKISNVKCNSCQLFFYEDTFFIYTSFSGDLSSAKFQIEIKSKENSIMNIEIVLPKYKNLYIDMLPFNKGDYYIGINEKKIRNNYFKTIEFDNMLNILKKNKIKNLGNYEFKELQIILKKKYRILSLKDKGVLWKKLDQ